MSEPASELSFARQGAVQVGAPSWQLRSSGARPLVFRVVTAEGGDSSGEAAQRYGGQGAMPRASKALPERAFKDGSESTPSTAGDGADTGAAAQPETRPSARPSATEEASYSQPPALAASPTDSVPAEAFASREGELTLMLEQRIEAFAEAAVELGAAYARTVAVAEGQLLDLAMALAAAIVEHEVERDPKLHVAMAKAALNTLGDSDRARLRVSPAAYEAIQETFEDDVIECDGVRVALEEDARISGLGCIADSPRARVDGRVQERLRAARRAIEDERRSSQEDDE